MVHVLDWHRAGLFLVCLLYIQHRVEAWSLPYVLNVL
jgi:hypothetical protein